MALTMTLNKDVIIAIFLLAVCGVLWFASYDIRVPDYGQLSPATWPRIIIGVLAFLNLIYLFQSLRAAGSEGEASGAAALSDQAGTSVTPKESNRVSESFYQHWKNVIWCFVLFGLYLYVLPWVGMLPGALAFVFLLLCALGGWQPRQLLLHALIAVITVGGMWSLFTYGLGVLLPSGRLFE